MRIFFTVHISVLFFYDEYWSSKSYSMILLHSLMSSNFFHNNLLGVLIVHSLLSSDLLMSDQYGFLYSP